jgi:diadenosine tetraphosphate (Ap4A) HIT family hydrolase
MTVFALDPQLAADSVAVAGLALSDLRLVDDARFPWVLLVPRRDGAAEIIDLDKGDRALLFEEITAVSAALKAATACDKLNVAALGNQVRQLHVHIVARFAGDPAWPGPVWGKGAAIAYRQEAREALVGKIRRALAA